MEFCVKKQAMLIFLFYDYFTFIKICTLGFSFGLGFFLCDEISLHNPGYPETGYVGQTSLRLTFGVLRHTV